MSATTCGWLVLAFPLAVGITDPPVLAQSPPLTFWL